VVLFDGKEVLLELKNTFIEAFFVEEINKIWISSEFRKKRIWIQIKINWIRSTSL
jgi:hypothetical protein